MGLKSLYLAAFNTALCGAWAYVLYLTVSICFINKGSAWDVYQAVEVPLKIAQTAAVMEVVHSALGVVRSPVMITGTQVASRLWVLWGIINLEPKIAAVFPLRMDIHVKDFQLVDAKVPLGFVSLMLAWGITEVIRYGFFALKELLGSVPYVMLWLRYTGFIVLYPIGVASELTMVYLALSLAPKKLARLSITMPNPLNMAFDYYVVCLVIVATYVPGLPMLYGYMLSQRRKILGGQGQAKKQQ